MTIYIVINTRESIHDVFTTNVTSQAMLAKSLLSSAEAKTALLDTMLVWVILVGFGYLLSSSHRIFLYFYIIYIAKDSFCFNKRRLTDISRRY